jgi:Ca2+-binding EF-hand superfamily protein
MGLGARADDKPKADKARGKPDSEAMFKRLDANADGKISKNEFSKFAEIVRDRLQDKGKAKNANGKFADAMFSRLDSNADRFISLEEFKKISDIRQKKKDQ